MKTKIKPRIIAMEAPIAIKAEEGESKGPPSFDVVAYTGGALNLGNFEYPVVVDLEGLELGKSLIANLDHERSKRVGHVTDTAKTDGQLTLAGKVSAATDAAREVVQSAAQGFVWQASIEAMPSRLTEVKAGDEIEVNGLKFTGPLYVAAKSTLKGFAFVSHGADDNTSVSIAASAAHSKESIMDKKLKEWIEAMGFDADELTPDQLAGLKANYEGRDAPPVKRPGASDPFTVRKEEAARRRDILAIGDQKSEAYEKAGRVEDIDAIRDLVEHAIEAGMSVQDFRFKLQEALTPLAQTVPAVRNPVGTKLTDKLLTAAICQTAGLNNLDAHFSDQELQTAKDAFNEGIGIRELLLTCARNNGLKYDGYNVTLDVQRAAFGLLPGIQASAPSSLSLPGILSNAAGKFLLEGWGGGEMTWAEISDSVNVRDFKTITQYKLSGNLKYEKVGAGGEIKHGTVSEGTYTNKADTYGKMFAITREHIVNDDLSAFSQVARELGYGANDAFNDVFWTLFLSNPGDFFHNDNANTSAGTVTSATVLATIAAAEVKFFAQTKPNGTPVGIMPNVILAPNGAYRVLQAAMGSGLVVGSTGPTPNANVFQGEYKVVRSAYLSSSAMTGNSAVKWYLLCVRPGFAVIQTAFLNGQRAPMIESASADFNTLGIQMRGVHDFGVSMFEYRAGVQGSGAG